MDREDGREIRHHLTICRRQYQAPPTNRTMTDDEKAAEKDETEEVQRHRPGHRCAAAISLARIVAVWLEMPPTIVMAATTVIATTNQRRREPPSATRMALPSCGNRPTIHSNHCSRRGIWRDADAESGASSARTRTRGLRPQHHDFEPALGAIDLQNATKKAHPNRLRMGLTRAAGKPSGTLRGGLIRVIKMSEAHDRLLSKALP